MGLVGKNTSKVRQHDPWSESTRLYHCKKSEIEDLFREVDSEMKLQHLRCLERKENGSQ
jgi:hypothetical protein